MVGGGGTVQQSFPPPQEGGCSEESPWGTGAGGLVEQVSPHRCVFPAAGQAPHKAADVIHGPLADILGGHGLLPICEESPHGAWLGVGVTVTGTWPFPRLPPVCRLAL